MELQITSTPDKKLKKNRRKVVINPDDLLPFEVTEELRVLYRDDEYKYLIHYARAFPTGQIPVLQYLLIRFHPLIIKLSGYYFQVLGMEWRDAISFSRQKFLELIYRFKLNSSLYFRTYIQIALRRALYDRVLFESRRKELSKATSLDNVPKEGNDIYPNELKVFQGSSEDAALVLKKLVSFVGTSERFSKEDKLIFKMRFMERATIENTKKALKIEAKISKTNVNKLKYTNLYILTRQRAIRDILKQYAQQKLI